MWACSMAAKRRGEGEVASMQWRAIEYTVHVLLQIAEMHSFNARLVLANIFSPVDTFQRMTFVLLIKFWILFS